MKTSLKGVPFKPKYKNLAPIVFLYSDLISLPVHPIQKQDRNILKLNNSKQLKKIVN